MNSSTLKHVFAWVALFGVGSAGAGDEISAAAIQQRFETETREFESAFSQFEASAGPGQEFRRDMSSLAAYLQSAMRNGPSAEVRQTAALYLPMMRDYLVALPAEAYVEVSHTLPGESAVWKKFPRSIGYESEGLPVSTARRFLNDMAEKNPDRATRGEALISLVRLEMRELDVPAYRAAFARLEPYKNVEDLGFRIAVLRPDNRVALGKKNPRFSLPVIGSPGQTFASESLAGKFYLMDFWATWCGPCLAERAVLHRVSDRYRDRNFEIISVSMDKSPEVVINYRRSRWKMPWTNLFLVGGQEGQIARDFDVDWIGLPRRVLVDPSGLVIALQDDLGRDSLEATLARFLGP